ncbi:bacillithiol biosynthesis cysteine-adding enzyme BshC (plasmid) [Deinococcus sp. KNUC1210]|uniref:bacillithiol biosynthesis cysteine-adding enzyme BshC n=1 Tax=Deinococcus sp. KNUC1210 TaxID=2917691 RepID=UPI001EEFB2DC|nr:bacillithiol biosynthesis cysteine-adding enzyme BshC [Deinococcus sp. KNUC1210]ULH14136.1 bacillithiol biosynthesis cysteine-adding enzyme BshC [Deinococcus sp. KNUC1210]
MTRPLTRRSVAAAYAAGDLSRFFRLHPSELDALHRREAFRPDLDRAALVDALRQYHRDLGTLDKTSESQLEHLLHPASGVVVTGQQAGVISGPAYSVHKAASAVLLAQDLDREDAPVVPIYWIASQDHDAEEVASTTLLDFSETLHRLTLDLPEGVPVGAIPWTPEYTRDVLALMQRFDAPEAHKQAVLNRLAFAFGPPTSERRSYADVFARLIHSLLGASGLLVLDPLHPALAKLMAPALKRELSSPLASSERIEAAAALLEAEGFEAQLRRPVGATNLFLTEDDGQRRLLRVSGKGSFETESGRYTRAELEALLDRAPERLTPAAGLRPIVQDSLLPTLAFVVGPGEIAYGAELREVYPLHGLEQPLLWPRLSVTWIESNVARLLSRLNTAAARFQADPEGTLGAALAKERGAASVSAERLTDLKAQFSRLAAELGELDASLEGAATRAGTRSLNQIERLQRLSLQALARAENDRSGQLDRLKLHLLPNGVPQEREMNFLTYLLKHGDAPLTLLMQQAAGGRAELTLD